MNKVTAFLLVVLVVALTFGLGFGYKKATEPKTYYQVYYEGKTLGVISSESELNDYINENGKVYKNKYNTSKVYAPTGVQVKKLVTYNGKVESVKDVYQKIEDEEEFTIKAYDMSIKKEANEKDEENKGKVTTTHVYVTDPDIFKEAVNTLIDTFVGEEAYNSYTNDTQAEITTTGEIVENVYVDEDITIKESKVPVTEKIYTDADELARFLLYGEDYEESVYTVKAGDTIENVAFNNQINPSELLISNEELTSETNLLYPGQQLKIAKVNPQISIVEESYVVEDVESAYSTEERYDDSILIGNDKVIQEGVNGLDRVSQRVKEINGEIVYVEPQGKEVLKSPVNKVVLKGSKYVPDVGSLTNWGWPTDSGWRLSSDYSYRTSPINGSRELHTGLDISGTGYGSKVYATNNGRVIIAEYHYSYGNYVVIDHNNGYMTLYAHMSRIATKVGQVVERGEVIGYVGMTGSATGPHVHYEVWDGCRYCDVNPSVLYPNGYR